MEIEQKQAPVIEQFVKQASTLNGSYLVNLIVEATSHPSLSAFSEILSDPNLLQLQRTESSMYIDLLRLFAHGTWTDYKRNEAQLPQLVPDQAVKLKQLSVLTLAEMNKVLSYDQLLKELEVANVRELEDFLINECMYVGIVEGKLNQLRRCFEVQFAAGRDLRHGQLENMMQSLTNWLDTSDNILSTIQEKMKWAETMCEEDKKHKMEVKSRLQDAKKSLHLKQASNQFRAQQDAFFFELNEEMDSEEDLSQSKRVDCRFSLRRRFEYRRGAEFVVYLMQKCIIYVKRLGEAD